MFLPRKVSDIFNSITEILRLNYGVAAQQRCIVKANRGFFYQLYGHNHSPAEPCPEQGGSFSPSHKMAWPSGIAGSWDSCLPGNVMSPGPWCCWRSFQTCNRKLQLSQSSSQSWRLSCDATPNVVQSPRVLLCCCYSHRFHPCDSGNYWQLKNFKNLVASFKASSSAVLEAT